MKKSEGELLREYAKIISEAEDQPDGFGTGSDRNFEDEVEEQPDDTNEINGWEDEGEPEFNDIQNNDDPISQLASYLDGLDPHEMTFSEAIEKFLHEHNLEIAPKNGLTNKVGEV